MPDIERHPHGVTGEHTRRGVPHGVTSLTPYLGVDDVMGAVDFYEQVFHARTIELTQMGATVVHAHLDLGNGHLHVEKANAESGLSGPSADGTASFSLSFYCEDVAAVLDRARAAGGRVLSPLTEFASGDLFVGIMDPHGVRWSITTRIRDLSEAASAGRIHAWAAELSRGSARA